MAHQLINILFRAFQSRFKGFQARVRYLPVASEYLAHKRIVNRRESVID